MPITPVTRHETFLAAAAQGDSSLTPITREEVFLNEIADAVSQGGGSADVTAAAVTTAIGNMTATQKTNTRTNLVVDKSATVETISGTTATIAASANTIYNCGELTALTISSVPASGAFTVIFTSGSTATVFTEPSGMTMPDGFSVEANKRYEINVSDGYAVVASWPVEESK